MYMHINPKYVAAKEALTFARSINPNKINLERAIAKMEKASSMPVEVLKSHIWNIYRQMEPKRVQHFIDIALMSARGSSINDKSEMESFLKYAREHSEMPLARSVIDYAHAEYQRHQSQRKYGALKFAFNSARGSSINDKFEMESFLKYAQEHSEMPLARSVIDYAHAEYQRHQSQRKYGALKFAFNSARGSSIKDKSEMESFLKYAREHSSGLMDKIVLYFAGLGIRGRYALRPVLNR